MTLSSASLQEEVEAVRRQAPTLPPHILPSGYDDQGLAAFVQQEGAARDDTTDRRALDKVLRRAAKGLQQCGVCGREAVPVTSTSGQAEKEALSEADLLRFATWWRVDFTKRLLRLHAGKFACGLCRALHQPGRLLIAAAAAPSTQHDSPQAATLRQIASHAAAVNGLGGQAEDLNASGAWLQELCSRAYGLQLVASSIRGWSMVGPGGEALQIGEPGLAARLAAELLHTPAPQPAGKAACKQAKSKATGRAEPDGLPASKRQKMQVQKQEAKQVALTASQRKQRPPSSAAQVSRSTGKKRRSLAALGDGSAGPPSDVKQRKMKAVGQQREVVAPQDSQPDATSPVAPRTAVKAKKKRALLKPPMSA